MTILLIDDDEDDISLFREIVRNEIDSTIDVIVRKNGALGLSTLSEIIPDIIFLDINMPVMNGRNCFDRIKSSENYKDIPIVIYSALFEDEEIVHFNTHGAQCLAKPMRVEDFVPKLKLVIRRNQELTVLLQNKLASN